MSNAEAEVKQGIHDIRRSIPYILEEIEGPCFNKTPRANYQTNFNDFKNTVFPHLSMFLKELSGTVFTIPSDNRQEREERAKRGAQYLYGVSCSLTNIKSLLAVLWSKDPATDFRPDGSKPDEFALVVFRCASLQMKIVALIHKIKEVCDVHFNFVRMLDSPNHGFSSQAIVKGWKNLADKDRRVQADMLNLSKWFDLSDSDVMEDRLVLITQQLQDILPIPTELIEKKVKHPEPLKDSIPIIELSVDFFSTLSKSAGLEPHAFFLLPPTQQIAIANTAKAFPVCLKEFVKEIVYENDEEDEPVEIDYEIRDEMYKILAQMTKTLTDYCESQKSESDCVHNPEDLGSLEEFRTSFESWISKFKTSIDTFYATYHRTFPNSQNIFES
ncbi:hypothetical protein MJO28_014884 [Puccinia striiformis f. sp. tritici]|uniref:Uncharacterized protein n=3 Tax=Puccinia striiformis TaxID=27350 RepID=A0A2S4V7W3_9BASI|nr:hypothetical protein MJO29_014673 [Puccinia striiformis f. sp. tritici]KAI7937964.1 hypothetical protein MJO28_014884 [Puccinia striiformis f. sp. tritici]POW05611.1 hypothetical protein PSTT_09540 [Puccinia striiformis]